MQFAKNSNIRPVGKSVSLDGLSEYTRDRDAIIGENSNDALHILYPDILHRQAATFLNGFNGHTLYAIKANPHPSLLKLLWTAGIRHFEVASLREVEIMASLLPDAILYFMHPVKSRFAIKRSYELGVRYFAFDCPEELQKIQQETGNASDLKLLMRLHMEQEMSLHPLSGKFGATVQEAPLLLQRASQLSDQLGVTFHVGSQCMDPSAYEMAIATVRDILDQAGVELDLLDIGGGFPVQYPQMTALPLGDYFDRIHTAVQKYGFGSVQLMSEPGRALVAEGGAVAVRVELRKGNVLYINDGTYGALFDAGASNWLYPMEAVSCTASPKSEVTQAYKMFGPTCDSLDVLEGPFELPEDIHEGDWVIFRHLGAYGQALQSRFNGFYSENTISVKF
jgi:ornithine decarboxylase